MKKLAAVVVLSVASFAASASCQMVFNGREYVNVCDNGPSYGDNRNVTVGRSGEVPANINLDTNSGSYTGRDNNQNPISGNVNTGYQQNHGTGRTCVGTGYARSCF